MVVDGGGVKINKEEEVDRGMIQRMDVDMTVKHQSTNCRENGGNRKRRYRTLERVAERRRRREQPHM